MMEIISEDIKFTMPLGDRYTMSVKAFVDGNTRDFDVEGYELSDIWNVSKERNATLDELSLLAEFKDEIGDSIDWDWVYSSMIEGDDSFYGYEDNCE